jgi:hypothetical protein
MNKKRQLRRSNLGFQQTHVLEHFVMVVDQFWVDQLRSDETSLSYLDFESIRFSNEEMHQQDQNLYLKC